jgi:hypothetical protein
VPDRDGVIVDQDFLDQQTDDFLPLGNFQRFRRVAKPLEERGQGFGQPEERHTVGGLIEDRLTFSPH